MFKNEDGSFDVSSIFMASLLATTCFLMAGLMLFNKSVPNEKISFDLKADVADLPARNDRQGITFNNIDYRDGSSSGRTSPVYGVKLVFSDGVSVLCESAELKKQLEDNGGKPVSVKISGVDEFESNYFFSFRFRRNHFNRMATDPVCK